VLYQGTHYTATLSHFYWAWMGACSVPTALKDTTTRTEWGLCGCMQCANSSEGHYHAHRKGPLWVHAACQ